jgi:hypothetical protein
MPRVVVIKQETDIQTIGSSLLGARTSSAQATNAIEALKTLNPHVADVKNIKPGTVLLVPDSPHFKASASVPASAGTLDDLQKLTRGGLTAAAARMKAADTARANELSELAGLQKLAAVKRAIDSDPQLKEQLGDAAKAAKAAQQEAAKAEAALDTMLKGATSELNELAKLLGQA